MDFFTTILGPIMWGEAWIMVAWHKLFTMLGLPSESGWAWGLSIVGLTAVVRALLIPLFVKQIHASRRMQLLQPELQKIQKKYKGKTDPDSRAALQRESMELYKNTGTNPFSSCLPILVQSPFFFALFQVLNNLKAIAEGNHAAIGPIDTARALEIEASSLFGAPLSSSFVGATNTSTKVVTVILIILMSVTTFTTQRQLMRKNMPDSALDNPFMKQQKVILYALPLFFAVSGINFPIGVLIYWLTTNLWSMGQQFYVIRRMPAPGSAAERAYRERQLRRGKTIREVTVPGLGGTPGKPAADGPVVEGSVISDGAGPSDAAAGAAKGDPGGRPAQTGGQRQQPTGKKRAKKQARKGTPPVAGRRPSPGAQGKPDRQSGRSDGSSTT